MMNKENIIKRLSLADDVAGRLQQKIQDGDFAIGEKLPTEPELMTVFGVGRSTIREAIRNLSNAGLVRVQQGLGTFVEQKQVGSESMTDRFLRAKGLELNEIRQLFELKVAEKAALNRTDEDILQMKKYLEERRKMALANIPDACIQADINFHLCIATASQSEILLDLYKTVARNMKEYFSELYIDTESFINTQEFHESLLQSIIDQNPQKAWEWAARITGQPV
ncbi:FadR/GntR family transcriptional regulator [Dyadobacter frigoris]|uniref:FadR family transcriptional regulator n=1 Tax=Dyadobacter frigoris TaxID=2576211 RepID=A0A4U6D8E2_9BACT|nr:FadR/GntR family transcriptional regulator [Dyadobacter frigoris]TKT93770.1 FadR family transcriptional regulator [Dyadobacter frigoris]GLU51017.1 GntR family transcriptional regulator [Dyadobacter frigoris]